MRITGLMAMLSLSVVLTAGCKASVIDGTEPDVTISGEDRGGKDTGAAEDTGATEDTEAAEDTASTEENGDGSMDAAVWFLDTDIEWTQAKETELPERLRGNYIRLDKPLRFIPVSESGYLAQVREFMKAYDGSLPVYFSAHNEAVMMKLQEEGIIDAYYEIKELDPKQQETGPQTFAVYKDSLEFWGSYLAMVLPASSSNQSSDYGQLPEVIMSSGMLTDFIRKPDMTKYVDSVDRRCFTFTGGNEEWDFEYQVDGSITLYNMDGRLSSESECQYEVTASYKKGLDVLNQTKKLAISYETSVGGGSLSDAIPYRDTVFKLRGASRGGAIVQGDEVIRVTVTMDDKTETFDLVNEELQQKH